MSVSVVVVQAVRQLAASAARKCVSAFKNASGRCASASDAAALVVRKLVANVNVVAAPVANVKSELVGVVVKGAQAAVVKAVVVAQAGRHNVRRSAVVAVAVAPTANVANRRSLALAVGVAKVGRVVAGDREIAAGAASAASARVVAAAVANARVAAVAVAVAVPLVR
ncbi:MAG: hypothetical protein ACI9S9_000438 [Planctomycetota bacterium]